MLLWNQVVEILRESIFAYTQACNGNLGAGILAVTFLARLALLPLGIRLARAAADQQRAMARLQPGLDALRTAHKGNPKRLAEETNRLMAREGVSPFSLAGGVGNLVQIPAVLALYSAVRQAATVGGRFLWIPQPREAGLATGSRCHGIHRPGDGHCGCCALAESLRDVDRLRGDHHRRTVEAGRRRRPVLGAVEPARRRPGLGGSTRRQPQSCISTFRRRLCVSRNSAGGLRPSRCPAGPRPPRAPRTPAAP